jgi:hypothetical protein
MGWNQDQSVIYLYRACEPNFGPVSRSGSAEDIRDVEVTESRSYAIDQMLYKSPGRIM